MSRTVSGPVSDQRSAEPIRFVTGVDYEIVERTPTNVIKEMMENHDDGCLVQINLWVSGPRGAHLVNALITEFVVVGGPNDSMVVKALIPSGNGNTFASITAELTPHDDLNNNLGSFELNRR